MNKATRAHNPRMMVALIAVLLLLAVAVAFALQPAAPIGADDPAFHATRAGGAGESDFTDDPYIERHADVVARYHEGSAR